MTKAKRPYAWPHPDEVVKRIVDAKKRPEARMRWHVIYLICRVDPKRKSPLKDKEIAAKVGFTVQHIGNVRRAFCEKGPDAMDMGFSFARPSAGRKAILSQDDLERLAAFLQKIEKPRWEDVQSYCKDVLKMEKPVSDATARRRFEDYLAGKFQPPQVADVPATPEKQTPLEKPVVAKESDKRLQPEGKTPLQESESATPEPESLADSSARADTKKGAKRRMSKKEQIERQQTNIFETFLDDQT